MVSRKYGSAWPIPSAPIAIGRTAEIYAWGEGRILKLLRPGFPPGLIKQEEAITSAVYQAGLAALIIYAVVEVNGRPGIVYARIDGPSLLEAKQRRPFRLREHAAQLARLHAAIHTHTYSPAPEDAPGQKKILASLHLSLPGLLSIGHARSPGRSASLADRPGSSENTI